MELSSYRWSGIAVFVVLAALVCLFTIDFESSNVRIVSVWEKTIPSPPPNPSPYSTSSADEQAVSGNALVPDMTTGNMNRTASLIPSLTFLTLSFGEVDPYATKVVTHNCLKFEQLRAANPDTFQHRMIVYTTSASQRPFCSVCGCVEFKYYGCPCIEDGTRKRPCKRRNACEKLYWVTDMLKTYSEFAVLDHDLVILKDSFAQDLALRSISNDFVATRAHSHLKSNNSDYFRFFNSGLFFIRSMPRVDPYVLRKWFYERNDKNRDQQIFSHYIHEMYDKWDELSYKWNCRFLDLQNIPVTDCYTMHEGEQRVYPLLESMNFQFLQLPTATPTPESLPVSAPDSAQSA